MAHIVGGLGIAHTTLHGHRIATVACVPVSIPGGSTAGLMERALYVNG